MSAGPLVYDLSQLTHDICNGHSNLRNLKVSPCVVNSILVERYLLVNCITGSGSAVAPRVLNSGPSLTGVTVLCPYPCLELVQSK